MFVPRRIKTLISARYFFKSMALLSKTTLFCLLLAFYALLTWAQNPGTATYYTPTYTPSACYGHEDHGVMVAAASEAIWNNGAACGQLFQVQCLSGTNAGTLFPCVGGATVVLQIVDLCPTGCRATIDLSQEAFATIADLNSGVINISYQQV